MTAFRTRSHGGGWIALTMLLVLTSGTCVQGQVINPAPWKALSLGHLIASDMTTDGLKVLTYSRSGAFLWNAGTGQLERRLPKHRGGISIGMFINGGSQVITGGYDHVLRVWNAQTGALVREYNLPMSSGNAILAPDGKHFASFWGKDIRIWDASTGGVTLMLPGSADWPQALVFTPDSRGLVSADGQVARLWELTSGTQVRTFTGHQNYIWSVAVSRNGARVLTGGEDNVAMLWDIATTAPLRTFTGHTAPINSVKFVNADQSALTGSSDGTARIWNLAGSGVQVLGSHPGGIMNVAMSAGGQRLMTGGNESVLLWDVNQSTETKRLVGHDGVGIHSAAYLPDGNRLLTGGGNGFIRMWDIGTGSLVRTFAAGTYARDIAVSPNGTRMLMAHPNNNTATEWNVETGALVRTLNEFINQVESVAYSPDGQEYLVSSHYIALKDAATGNTIREYNHGPAYDLKFSHAGDQFVVAGGDNNVRVWKLTDTGPYRLLTGHGDWLQAVAFSPDDKQVFSASKDHTARQWDVLKGTLVRTFTGHSDMLRCLDVSPNGYMLATGGLDDSVRVWDTRTGALTRLFNDRFHNVNAVLFSPDGTILLIGGEDGSAYLYQVDHSWWSNASKPEWRRYE